MNKIKIIFFLVFIFSFLVFYLHAAIVGSAVWGDGQYYYSFVRSAVIDRDLDFRNELAYFGRAVDYTKTGMAANKYSIGPALFWLPFFLMAHLLIVFLNFFTFNQSFDGYNTVYQAMTGLGTVFYGISGLWFCFLSTRKYFSEKIALISSLGLWLSSNLFFYTAVDPINSHSVSFFISSLVVYFIISSAFKKSLQSILKFSLVSGVLAGLLTLIRNQDVIYILLTPLIYGFGVNFIFFLFSFFFTFVPQLLVWQYLYGQFGNPYLLSGEKFFLLNPKIISVLWGRESGLFYYSPVLILAFLGLLFFFKKQKRLVFAGLVLFILETYLISSWHYYSQGASYGGRMFISLYPFFIIGLAGFLDRLKLRYDYKAIYIIITLFTALNFSSIVVYLLTSP